MMSNASAAERLTFRDCYEDTDSFEQALLDGLSAKQKAIPCRFLYDKRGSELFDRICTLPEYYPTRTETAILKAHAADVAGHIGPRACVVELGSGSSTKTRILLGALDAPDCYAPVDVSREHLRQAAASIARDYPRLRVEAICADYSADFALPEGDGRTAAFFPGSTIGNLTRREAHALLSHWRRKLGADGLMVLGVDLKKDAATLEAAYDDSEGVTEAFIKNILVRANTELGADFNVKSFAYEARWREEPGRVEMHLRSVRDQVVTMGRARIPLEAGERIHVENSHKYTVAEAVELGRMAGFAPVACFTDAAKRFSVHVWAAA
ncbi:MAG: L-histidine N(alpha)-methyltransferase [Hyphomonadaceae bacterium]